MDLGAFDELKMRLNLSRLSKPALIGIVAILVMVAVAAGRLLIGTATASEFTITRDNVATAQEDDSRDAPEPKAIYVHVSGEVANPGLVQVESGSRVADAVNAAGGFKEDAATDSVNLARVLVDGEQIVIASKQTSVLQSDALPAQESPGPNSYAQNPGKASGLVNINTADEAELTSLPGIGQSTAAKIVADRKANGAFKTCEDLKRVSGIGDKKYEALSGLICV